MSSVESIIPLISRALDACALRQSVHTSNIANANVEGYRRMEVVFEQTLENAMQSNVVAAETQNSASAQIVYTNENVKLDQEMAQMSQNALRYQALIGAFEKTVGLLRLAVREGREG